MCFVLCEVHACMKLSQKLLSGRNSCGVKQCAVKLQFLLLLLDFHGTVYFESLDEVDVANSKKKVVSLYFFGVVGFASKSKIIKF